jgi:putative peptidoglycan lipid II flippase
MQETSSTQSANRQIARAAGTVMFAMIISQLTGLAAKMLITRAFGAGWEVDAFYAANSFCEILFNLMAGGALGSAFIPTFTGFLTRGERAGAWKLASAIYTLLFLVLGCVSLLAAIFAPLVVRYLLAPGFVANPDQFALTVTLLRIQLPSVIIFAFSGLSMGILNSHQNFLIPALAPSMYQAGLMVGALLAPYFGIYGMGASVVVGAACHFLLQVPALLRLPQRHIGPTLGRGMAAVREVIVLMGPRLLGVAVVQVNFLVNTYLASFQPEGSILSIKYAFALMLMPQAAIAQAIAIAALPTFSAQVALGRKDEMRSSLAATLRGVLLLALPSTLGLILLRLPLVEFLFEHGKFTDASTVMVAWALLWYALGLVGHSVMEIVSRAFYALHDTRTPVTVGVVAMSLNVVFSLLFSWLFSRVGWAPHGGLALANSLATFLEMIGLLWLMRRRLGGLEGKKITAAVLQGGVASLGMGLAVWGLLQLLAAHSAAVKTLGGVAAGGAIYALLLVALRVPEVKSGILFIKSKISR